MEENVIVKQNIVTETEHCQWNRTLAVHLRGLRDIYTRPYLHSKTKHCQWKNV